MNIKGTNTKVWGFGFFIRQLNEDSVSISKEQEMKKYLKQAINSARQLGIDKNELEQTIDKLYD